MSTEALLSRLDCVKRTGRGRWIARCVAHDDKSPSLVIRETDDGKILLKCFAGCQVTEILAAVSLDISELFPPRESLGKPERRPFPTADVLRCLAFEALVVVSAGVALLAGQPFSELDRERLMIAVGRIQDALTAAGVHHD